MQKRNSIRSLFTMLALPGLVALAGLVLVAVAIIPSGCQGRKEVDLLFETIEKSERSRYSMPDSKMVIITEAGERNALESIVSLNAQAQLQDLDFDQYFAVAVFQGLKGTNMYGADIQRMARRGDTITVYAHFTERDPELVAADINTSPYHLVKVQKGGTLQGRIEFVLNVDGTMVDQQTHLLP